MINPTIVGYLGPFTGATTPKGQTVVYKLSIRSAMIDLPVKRRTHELET